jgi:hypothetical protein
MIKNYLVLFFATCIAALTLTYIGNLEYESEDMPPFDLIEFLLVSFFGYIPVALGLLATNLLAKPNQKPWFQPLIATLICASLLTLGLSLLLDWIDEFIDGMYFDEIASPTLYVFYIFATTGLPVAVISYGFTALWCRFTGTKLFASTSQ